MGFNNPPITWQELERTLSTPAGKPFPAQDVPVSWRRGPYRPLPIERPDDVVPYAELHAHSSFSFLDGASGPAELAEEAERLGLHALAITDHDGLYGIVRLAEAAETMRLKTVFGAELSLELPAPQAGVPDPAGSHLLVLAAGEEGYHRLAAAITHGQLAGGEKGRPVYDLDDLAARADGHWVVLTGCRKGAVRQALASGGVDAAGQELDALVHRFGAERVFVELTDTGHPLDSDTNDALAVLAASRHLPALATGNVHYATPAQHPLAQAVAAVRANRSLDALDGWLPAAGTAFLRSGAEMAERFARYPGAVARTVELADELAFPLRRAKPALPKQEVPPGHTPMSWLRHLVWEAVPVRYPDLTEADAARIEKELGVIEAKDFPGYFLIVHDIVAEARRRGILCQGRGSAANSAVCYLLGITAVDSIAYDLPFERFLSALRDEEPDIDVDFDADRREEIIQWVFERYGRERAAQVCNVIQYRPKNAVRDISRALGYSPGQGDAFARQVERWGSSVSTQDTELPEAVVDLTVQLLKAPRHLGIHSCGMVLTERPVGEVVPIEHARMDARTVIQWDKDDAAWMGLVKFDLLGLGMLAALQHCFDLVRDGVGETWDLASMPKEEQGVYDMLCRADSIGVFQVESRAQMGLLPRLQPRRFYDLVIQIALIRPGPIQGGAVHPFVRRKLGREPVTYPHPLLEPVLERTLGVPVFQEQLMQMAMAVGECSGEDADLLRRAMGSKRGLERIESLKTKLYEGMARNGLVGAEADHLYAQIQAFSNFGFAESHSLSFALLVYASSWMKLHYPAAFLAGLLRAQPMGFYSPATLVSDARRHGVEVRRPDLARSGVDAGLEPLEEPVAAGAHEGHHEGQPTKPVESSRQARRAEDSAAALRDALARSAHERSSGIVPAAVPEEAREASRHEGPPTKSVESTRQARRAEDSAAATRLVEPVETAAIGSSRQARRAGDSAHQRSVRATGMESCTSRHQPPVGEFDPAAPDTTLEHRRDGNVAVRLGLAGVRGIGKGVAERIVAERDAHGAYRSMEDLVRRTGLAAENLEALAAAGALECLGLTRRQALWRAGSAALDQPDSLPGTLVASQPLLFEDPTPTEVLADDLWATGVSTADHPIAQLRTDLTDRGVLSTADLFTAEPDRRVEVAGLVTHRQRPATASGITFLSLEDEHGLVNIVCSVGVWQRYRRVARGSSALIVRGKLERSPEGVVNVVADRLEALPIMVVHRSRDFH